MPAIGDGQAMAHQKGTETLHIEACMQSLATPHSCLNHVARFKHKQQQLCRAHPSIWAERQADHMADYPMCIVPVCLFPFHTHTHSSQTLNIQHLRHPWIGVGKGSEAIGTRRSEEPV
eukprot:733853-Pelagomonas_calceolata.AAC.2